MLLDHASLQFTFLGVCYDDEDDHDDVANEDDAIFFIFCCSVSCFLFFVTCLVLLVDWAAILAHSPHHSGNLAPTITFLSPNSPSSYCHSAQKSFTRLAKKVKVNMNTFGPLGVSNQSIRSLPCRFGVMVRREAANMWLESICVIHLFICYIIFVVFLLGLGFQKPVQAYSLFNGILACAFCPKKEGSSICLSPCSFVRLHTYMCVYKQTCVGEYIPYMVYIYTYICGAAVEWSGREVQCNQLKLMDNSLYKVIIIIIVILSGIQSHHRHHNNTWSCIQRHILLLNSLTSSEALVQCWSTSTIYQGNFFRFGEKLSTHIFSCYKSKAGPFVVI